MNTNNAFLGTNRMNPFLYQKFGLEQITLRRNTLSIASTPVNTQNHKCLFFNHCQRCVCCTVGWESLWIFLLCVPISREPSRLLMNSCIQNLPTAQIHSIFNSQPLWQQTCKLLFGVNARSVFSFHLTAKLQGTSFQFRQSENG